VDIKSIADCAAILRRRGIRNVKIAVEKALDQYRIHERFERETLFRAVCSKLGRRGAKRKQKLAKEKKCRVPVQMKMNLSPPAA